MADIRHTTIAVLMSEVTDKVCSSGDALLPSLLKASDFPEMGSPEDAPYPHLTREDREDLADCLYPSPPIADQHGRPARGPSLTEWERLMVEDRDPAPVSISLPTITSAAGSLERLRRELEARGGDDE